MQLGHHATRVDIDEWPEEDRLPRTRVVREERRVAFHKARAPDLLEAPDHLVGVVVDHDLQPLAGHRAIRAHTQCIHAHPRVARGLFSRTHQASFSGGSVKTTRYSPRAIA